jgi:hypothetical protein
MTKSRNSTKPAKPHPGCGDRVVDKKLQSELSRIDADWKPGDAAINTQKRSYAS